MQFSLFVRQFQHWNRSKHEVVEQLGQGLAALRGMELRGPAELKKSWCVADAVEGGACCVGVRWRLLKYQVRLPGACGGYTGCAHAWEWCVGAGGVAAAAGGERVFGAFRG